MSSLEEFHVEKCCRVCLCQDLERMSRIFNNDQSTQEEAIADMLSECTKYKVLLSDNLPKLICVECVKAVKNAYAFKRKCEESYRTLISLIPKNIADIDSMEIFDNTKCTQTDDFKYYFCEHCDEQFFTVDGLKLHSESKHKDIDIVCRYCAHTFENFDSLRSHVEELHVEQEAIPTTQTPLSQHLEIMYHTNNMPKIDFTSTNEFSMSFKVPDLDFKIDQNDTDGQGMADIKPEIDSENLKSTVNSETDIMLTEKINTLLPTKGFMEVLLDENSHDESIDLDFNGLEEDSVNTYNIDVLENIKRRRGRPSKLMKNSLNFTSNCDKQEEMEEFVSINSAEVICPNKICFKTFTTTTELETHMNTVHHSSKQMKCKECNQEFKNFTDFKHHKDTEHNEKSYICKTCNKGFTTKNYLQRHMTKHKCKIYTCKECGESYFSKVELNTHIKNEGHDKPLLCPECGLRCKTSNILMVHMRRHKGDKPFKCKFCSKGFARIDDLKIHEKYHTNERSHFCETCGKGFQRKYNLTIHLRVHTGEKPYKCSHCPQAFAQGNDLKAHIRRHTGERFICDVCDAAFLQGYQIRQHKLRKHGIKEIPPTQRVEKFLSPEDQQRQIQQNLKKELEQN